VSDTARVTVFLDRDGTINREERHLSRSWMIGDKLSDVQAGRRAGSRTVLVATGYGEEHFNLPERQACVDYYVPLLREAAALIVQQETSQGKAKK